MQCQLVCDNDMKFTVYCGWPGAVHDACVLGNSPLFQDTEARTDDLFLDETYIVVDATYPLKTWLLTGFKDNSLFTAQQRHFTHLLSSKRIVAEHSKGLLQR